MEGKVYLVGAGPGDEGLLTIKGLQKLKEADVVVYDYLSNASFLKHCKEGVEKIYAGKQSGNHTIKQEQINALLVEKAKEGKTVVRLKGGDPYVFGRGAEEGRVLEAEGISFEVIPGVTSSIAGLSYAGIPITHRKAASSFHVFTAHFKDGKDHLDWEQIAKLEGTLVFLMGVAQLENICLKLIKNKKDKRTPVAIIERATTAYQKVVEGTLETIVEKAQKAEIKPPSLIVIGEVVKERKSLNWFEKSPLFSKKIILTRAKQNNAFLEENLKALGAKPLIFSSIKTVPMEENIALAIEALKDSTYLIFSSKEGVKFFFEGLYKKGKDARALSHLKVAAIGEPTKKYLQTYGIVADLVPQTYVGEGLVTALEKVVTKQDCLLFPRSKKAREKTIEELEKFTKVKAVAIYDTLEEEIDKRQLEQALSEGVWGLTFTSASTVHSFMSALNQEQKKQLQNIRLFSIGPLTSEAIRSYEYEPFVEAKEHTLEGLLKAMIENVEERRD